MQKEFLSAVFCPPTGAWADVPDRLTDGVFTVLKNAGVNRVLAFGMDDRAETRETTFRQCQAFGMGYLPCVPSAEDYCRVLPDEKGKPWGALTQQEREALDERFVEEVRALSERPAFRGIFFEDECGYLSFPGIAHAKQVFDRHFPGCEFHANFFSYSINEDIFWGGMAFHGRPGASRDMELPFALDGDLAITFENRFRLYDVLVEGLLGKAKFEWISQDKYPFEEFWPQVPSSVHVALFELNAFLKQKSVKYASRYYNFMQLGQWCGGRKMTFGEMALQMNVTAAYGASGFGWFPGVFPLDWRDNPAGRDGSAGFIDLGGEPTPLAGWVTAIHRFLSGFAEDILQAELLGVTAYGTYDNGFDWEAVKDLPDAECIYHGQLPDMLRYRDPAVTAETTNQLLLSVFQRDGNKRYYGVNTSSVYENRVRLTLPKGTYSVYTMEGCFQSGPELNAVLQPGCGLYIRRNEA